MGQVRPYTVPNYDTKGMIMTAFQKNFILRETALLCLFTIKLTFYLEYYRTQQHQVEPNPSIVLMDKHPFHLRLEYKHMIAFRVCNDIVIQYQMFPV